MADEEKVIFDRKTAEVLLEMARWWQSNGPPRKKPQPPPSGRSGVEVRIAEVVTVDGTGPDCTIKLLFGNSQVDEITSYESLTDGPTVDAKNWLAIGGVDAEATNSDTLTVGQKVLVASLFGAWAVVGVLSGAYVDLIKPDLVNDGYGDDIPGVICTADSSSTTPRTYVVDSLYGLLEKSIGGGSEGDPDTELFALCVKRSSVVESLFLRSLGDLVN